jgi:hypothetical protein
MQRQRQSRVSVLISKENENVILCNVIVIEILVEYENNYGNFTAFEHALYQRAEAFADGMFVFVLIMIK